MGVRGTTLTWFKNYLAGRSQYLDINGTKSESLSLEISVIQGSILGPILFLCYINDFYSATALFSVLFADDTICLGNGINLNDLKVRKHEHFFLTFYAETETLWSQGPVTRDF
jgi:hypothetical protein